MPRVVDDDYSDEDDRPHRQRGGSNRLSVSYGGGRQRSRSRGQDEGPANINIYNTADAYQEGPNQQIRGRAYPSQPSYNYYPTAIPQVIPQQVIQQAPVPAIMSPPVVYVPNRSRRHHRSRSYSTSRSRSRSRSHSHSKHSPPAKNRYEEEEERKRIIADWRIKEDEKKAAEKAAVERAKVEQARKELEDEEAEKEAVARHAAKLKEEQEEKKKIWEEFELKRKEKEELEKEAKIKADEEYKERMRKHLAKCGYAPNQIETMIEMEKMKITNDTPGTLMVAPKSKSHGRVIPGVRTSVYPKIRRKDLAEETLKHYGLEWEYDAKDTNYIIILQEMTETETDVLFLHTQRLREKGHGTRILTIEEKKDRGREPELLLVRRKSKNERSKSRTRDKSQTRGARFAAGVLGL